MRGRQRVLPVETVTRAAVVVVLVRLMALMEMMVVLVSGAVAEVLVVPALEVLLVLEAHQHKVAMVVTVLLMERLLVAEEVPSLVVVEITRAMVRMVRSGLLG